MAVPAPKTYDFQTLYDKTGKNVSVNKNAVDKYLGMGYTTSRPGGTPASVPQPKVMPHMVAGPGTILSTGQKTNAPRPAFVPYQDANGVNVLTQKMQDVRNNFRAAHPNAQGALSTNPYDPSNKVITHSDFDNIVAPKPKVGAPVSAGGVPTPVPNQPPAINTNQFIPPPPQPENKIPEFKPVIPPMDMDQIRAYAEQAVARKLADARLAADQTIGRGQQTAQRQLGALQTDYDRAEALQQDNRNLENNKFDRSNNPFSGGTDFRKGLLERERAITDRYENQDLATRQAAINQDLATLENTINEKYQALANAAPDERQQLIQSIKNDERQYDLMLHGELRSDILGNAQLTNQEFNRALQAFNVNRGVFESDRDYELRKNAQELTAKKIQQDLDTGLIDQQTAQYKLDQLQDPNSTYNQAQDLDLQLKQLDLKNAPEEARLRLEQLRKTIAQIGKEPPKNETQAELDQVKLDTAKKQLELLNNPPAETTTTSYDKDVSRIADFYVTVDPYDKTVSIRDKEGMRNAIIALNMPDDETDKYLSIYGLPINP